MIFQQFDKELIRTRMLRQAVAAWSLKNTDSIDPVAGLILEALSTELQHAYHDIQNTEVRILDKLARLLTPDLLVAPHPAHAIAHATSTETGQKLGIHHQYFFSKKLPAYEGQPAPETCRVCFSPVDEVPLIRGDVSWIATGGRLSATDRETGTKRPDGSYPMREPLPYGIVWLGIDLEPGEYADEICFYLDWNFSRERWLYHFLALTQWTCGDLTLHVAAGMAAQQAHTNLFRHHDQVARIEDEVRNTYNNHFITVRGIPRNAATEAVPTELAAHMSPTVQSMLQQRRTLWLRVEFPPVYTPDMLQDVRISMNTFPVINRSLKFLRHTMRPFNNIIALETGFQEYFLAVHEVTDGAGTPYSSTPDQGNNDLPAGHYNLRFGGAERFDARDARELIQYLLELLRDEAAAFSAYGKDFIEGVIRELNIRINVLDAKAGKDRNRLVDTPTYLSVTPLGNDRDIEVQYWLTNGALADNIRAGSTLPAMPGTLQGTDHITLYTRSRGGRPRIQSQDRLNAYRHTLTAGHKLITEEDIRRFCMAHLGSRLKEVRLQKGLMPATPPSTGWLRTTDIVLELSELTGTESAAILCADLLEHIRRNTAASIHYRVLPG